MVYKLPLLLLRVGLHYLISFFRISKLEFKMTDVAAKDQELCNKVNFYSFSFNMAILGQKILHYLLRSDRHASQ